MYDNSYMIKIEYYIGETRKTKYITVEEPDKSIELNSTIEIKYNPKNNAIYIPKFVNRFETLPVCVISGTIAAVCFKAPTDSKKALETFIGLEKKI